MAKTPLPIANGFYESESLPLSAQECVNWYRNVPEAPALNQETLFGSAGLTQEATTGDLSLNADRGSITFKDQYYAVHGGSLVRMNVDNSIDILGAITGTGRLTMVKNTTQIGIFVPGGDGFIFTTGPDNLAPITAPGFTANGNPQFVVFVDTFFVATTDENKFIISGINDGTAWDALDFETAASSPDAITAPFVYRNQLFIGGKETTEGETNNAQVTGSDFPFVRSGLFFDIGIFAPFSIVNSPDSVMFVGGGKDQSPAVWQLIGNSLRKISTTAIDSVLQRLTEQEVNDIFGTAYAQRGAYFSRFTFPDTTFVFNTITNRWHEEKSLTVKSNVSTITRSRINSVATAYGKVLVGDFLDGRIGSIDPDVYTEYGGVIFRRVASQPFQNNMNSFFVPKLELTMEAGVGNDDDPDPVIRMDRSLNGKTFKDERRRKIGKKGDFGRRTIWNRNGRAARFEIFRFTLTDAVKPIIIQLTADIVGGDK